MAEYMVDALSEDELQILKWAATRVGKDMAAATELLRALDAICNERKASYSDVIIAAYSLMKHDLAEVKAQAAFIREAIGSAKLDPAGVQ